MVKSLIVVSSPALILASSNARSPTIVKATPFPVPMELLTVILESVNTNQNHYRKFELASPALYTPCTLVLPLTTAMIVRLALVLNARPKSLAKVLVWPKGGLQSSEFVVWLVPSVNTIIIVSLFAFAGIFSN